MKNILRGFSSIAKTASSIAKKEITEYSTIHPAEYPYYYGKMNIPSIFSQPTDVRNDKLTLIQGLTRQEELDMIVQNENESRLKLKK